MIDRRVIDGCWLEGLPEEALFDLNRVAMTRTFTANQFLFHKGDEPNGLFGLVSGLVHVSATNFAGDEVVFTAITPGKWFGELAVLDRKARSHDSYAAEESKIVVVPQSTLSGLLDKHHSIYKALVQLQCFHCRIAFSEIDNVLLCSPKERLAQRMMTISDRGNGGIMIKASQEELSQLVGISRQSVNKFLKEWEADGVIERRYGKIQVLKRENLELIGLKS